MSRRSMIIRERVSMAVAAAMIGSDDEKMVWTFLAEGERERAREVADRAIEAYVAAVSDPLL